MTDVGVLQESEVSAVDRPVRLVLADDGAWLRRCMADALRDDGFDVVAEASDRASALEAVRHHDPDVAVLDVRMPPTCTNEGVLVAKELRASGWSGGLVLMSSEVNVAVVADLLESCSGGVGYVDKNDVGASGWEVTEAIRRVHRGEPVVPASIVQQLIRRARRVNPLDALTPTQMRVLSLVAEGLSNVGIAERLYVNHRTVETHVSDVFRILGLDRSPGDHRRVLATLIYLRFLR